MEQLTELEHCQKCQRPLVKLPAQASITILKEIAGQQKRTNPKKWANTTGPLCPPCLAKNKNQEINA